MSRQTPKRPGPPRTCDRCGRRKVRHTHASKRWCRRCHTDFLTDPRSGRATEWRATCIAPDPDPHDDGEGER